MILGEKMISKDDVTIKDMKACCHYEVNNKIENNKYTERKVGNYIIIK